MAGKKEISNGTSLIIVESPTKSKTIKNFLGKNYQITATMGHVRDLPKSKMGIEIENNFNPLYSIIPKARPVISDLKKMAKQADTVYFATDADREGEAISWHLSEILKLPKKKIKRIVFHEITKEAIEEALQNPRDINLNMVNAQQARRILDRLVGYELSPFLWKKIARGLSAGRVQSAALRLIVDKENEIKKFKAEEYWSIEAIFQKEDLKNEFLASLYKIKDKQLDKLSINSEKQAKEISQELENTKYSISDIQKKEIKKTPPTPFTTSLLQQEANRKLGFTAKKTMFIAQGLYEGIELEEGKPIGLITYMRTDSFNLADKFLMEAQKFIKDTLSPNYALEEPRRFKAKSKLAQEAHEAIRPTFAFRPPESVQKFLSDEQFKLYNLIWRRSIASQMKEAIVDSTSIEIKNEHDYFFKATGSTIKFDGFMKIYPSSMEENILPELKINETVLLKNLEKKQHFTQPPARYSEASLIKALEEYGIGRPSTYAPTISTIQDRNYVIRENNRFVPQEIGILVNNLLVEHFPNIVDLKFTAKVEDDLDEIAEAKKEWEEVIKEFYFPFKENLLAKEKIVAKKELVQEKTNEVCEKCGKPMVVKMSRYGKFLACSGFPECRNIKPIITSVGVKCPQCKEGDILERKTKKGRIFYSCSNFPKCKFALWQKPLNKNCPNCGSLLVQGKNKINCSNKSCSYSTTELEKN